jgi:DNA-binding IclR family transcriptional regulator
MSSTNTSQVSVRRARGSRKAVAPPEGLASALEPTQADPSFQSTAPPDRAAAATSLGKAFEILDLFSMTTPLVRIEDIATRLGYTRSSAYRYLKELCDAGLLAPFASGAYGLGPRIMELERLLELTDPLYTAGRAVLGATRSRQDVYLLHSLYRDKVLCIYKEGPEALVYRGRKIVVRRARGLPFPLFQGAASLALLANMSGHRIKQTWLRHPERIAEAGLGDSLDAFRASLAAIRRAGFATSRGQITPLLAGVAVPILRPDDGRLVGSLAQTLTVDQMTDQIVQRCAGKLARMSGEIAGRYVKGLGRIGTGGMISVGE